MTPVRLPREYRPLIPHALSRAVGRAGVVALAAQTVVGCYSYAPVAGVAPAGRTVVLELTDQARLDLRGAIGEFPLRVEGRVAGVTDSTYTLAVRNVESIRGDAANWTGEPVTFRRSGVSVVRVKRLDRTRTVLAAAIGVGAVAAFVLTRSLLGRGDQDNPNTRPPGEPPGNQ